jgi:hypothetical protein
MNKIIITTINKETEAITKFKSLDNWDLILVGDKKTPDYVDDKIQFIPYSKQDEQYTISKSLPVNSYCRKNIGYIEAIKAGADVIYETDDDNIPYKFWDSESFRTNRVLTSSEQFANIYAYLSNEKIWARGFPLDLINKQIVHKIDERESAVGVWQTLIDHDPDVDAIYRLTINKHVNFDVKESFAITEGVYAPFNSQSTFWNKECFLYLYFPTTVSWRFSDILRSYITQRLLWQDGYKLGFRKSIVFQDRFREDYMKDFADEIPLYLETQKTIKILNKMKFTSSKTDNLIKVYTALSENGIVKKEELDVLKLWIETLGA